MEVKGGNAKYRLYRAEMATKAIVLQKANNTCLQDILFAVTPERGRDCIHLTSLVRIYISTRLIQVGSWREW